MSPDIREKLEHYQTLLVQWQKTINLVSPKTIPDAWNRHFEDSLQLNDYIDADAKTLYDFGSGAGFPALVLAITRPELSVTVIESDARKCAFLQTVSRETGCKNVKILNDRIEKSLVNLSCPDYITARAFASLVDILTLVLLLPDQGRGIKLVLPKGRNFQEELAEAAQKFTFDHDVHPSKIENDSVILCVRNIQQIS